MSWAIPAPWAAQLEVFILLLARALGLFAVAPIFRGTGVPPLVRMGLAGVTAALLVGPAGDRVASAVGPLFEAGPWAFGVLAGEFAVGAALGFVVALFVSAVQVAGQLMDLPLGFGMVNVLDPQTGTYAPVLGQFQSVLAMLVFFGVNAHHAVLRALAASYGSIPPGGPVASIPLPAVVAAFGDAFALGVRLAIPLVAAAFLTDVALAVVSRAVPQINVFITGFPLKIMVGMAMLALVLPAYVALLAFAFGDGGSMMRAIAAVLGGR